MPDAPRDPQIDQVLEFWFGELDERGMSASHKSQAWWKKDDDFDAEIRTRFGALRDAIVAGEREHWRDTPQGLIAYVVVLDQFSRNLGRGTPEMFACDAQALAAALAAIDAGVDAALPTDMRSFLYMPLMHSESLEHQDRCIALFRAAAEGAQGKARERFEGSASFAEAHRKIIARFGRFPHRNAVLGRTSTAEEEAFLLEPGSGF